MIKINKLLSAVKISNKKLNVCIVVLNNNTHRIFLQLLWKYKLIKGYSTISNKNYLNIWHKKSNVIKSKITPYKTEKKAKKTATLIRFRLKLVYGSLIFTNKRGIQFSCSV